MPRHRRALPFAALLVGVVLLVPGCSGTAGDAGRAEADERAAPAAGATRVAKRKPRPTWATSAPVRVVMNDRFRYRPAAIMVRAGRGSSST